MRMFRPFERYLISILLSMLHIDRYATASARSDGLLLLCGGRDASSVVNFLTSPFAV